tara:strand:- start:4348 stop:5577 length:1230 start_codon:yes stop_codon:yes gene_type:complete
MKTKYDWIVIGGGVSGITIAEILVREGKSVLLLEKNDSLVSETSKEFHEWFHSGALHTLAPDNLLTLRYLLGATDDMFEFYGSFERMNISPTEKGIKISSSGWFNKNLIDFRFKKHKWNPVWLAMVSRSVSIIEKIKKHDWLRRRAGSEYAGSQVKLSNWFSHVGPQFKGKESFYTKTSPDFTMNSRVLLGDILSAAISQGLMIQTNEEVLDIKETSDHVSVKTNNEEYIGKNTVVSSPDAISKIFGTKIKIGYAPMAIVEDVPEDAVSFVELDYYLSKCINLLTKGNGIGQAGGITLNKEAEIKPYLNYILKEHKKRNPSIKLIDTYVGIKKELVMKGQSRNYLYHINQNSPKVWSVILGKFTLAFSMAPEFYRRNYHKNPSKSVKPFKNVDNSLLSDTSWLEIVKNK